MGGFLPPEFSLGHELSYTLHDVLVELLRAGEAHEVFGKAIAFRDPDEKRTFEECAGDIFMWLDKAGRRDDLSDVLQRTVFPALLSDFLHFTYESLATSRKAKLVVAYALVRKPFQENLFILETIAATPGRFAEMFRSAPMQLRAQKAGDLEVHRKRVAEVLRQVPKGEDFDASFLVQLRYDKGSEDSFERIWNHAIHLFTEHKSLKTEEMNVNLIFSDDEARWTQWAFLYSRVPYLLAYARRLVELVYQRFVQTCPEYLAEMDRQCDAGLVLWGRAIEDPYRHKAIDHLVDRTWSRLSATCASAGWPIADEADLQRMFQLGAWPGESRMSLLRRRLRYLQRRFVDRLGRAVSEPRGRL